MKKIHKSQLGRITNALSSGRLRITAQYVSGFDQAIDLRVTQLLGSNFFVIAIELLCAHAVLGQRSCLIGTDNRYTAKTFHRVDILNDGMLFCHL